MTPGLSSSKLQPYSGPTRHTELSRIDGLLVFQRKKFSVKGSDHTVSVSNAEDTCCVPRVPSASPVEILETRADKTFTHLHSHSTESCGRAVTCPDGGESN